MERKTQYMGELEEFLIERIEAMEGEHSQKMEYLHKLSEFISSTLDAARSRWVKWMNGSTRSTGLHLLRGIRNSVALSQVRGYIRQNRPAYRPRKLRPRHRPLRPMLRQVRPRWRPRREQVYAME